jgi:hypothetical protein
MTKQDLFELYLSDPELIEKWHFLAGEEITTCVDDTWNIIKDHEIHVYNFGYFSIDRSDLVTKLGGFFIRPEFRTPEIKKLWYKELCSKMPAVFTAGLHNRNVRGIKFLASLPECKMTKVTDKYSFFIFRQGNTLCQ